MTLDAEIAKLRAERAEMVALLEATGDYQATDYCDGAEGDETISAECYDENPCWSHRAAALLAKLRGTPMTDRPAQSAPVCKCGGSGISSITCRWCSNPAPPASPERPGEAHPCGHTQKERSEGWCGQGCFVPVEKPEPITPADVSRIAGEVKAAYQEAKAETTEMARELNARDEKRASEKTQK